MSRRRHRKPTAKQIRKRKLSYSSFDAYMAIHIAQMARWKRLSRRFRPFPNGNDGPRVLSTSFKVISDVRCWPNIEFVRIYPITCLGCRHLMTDGFADRECAHPSMIEAYGCPQGMGMRPFRLKDGRKIPRALNDCPAMVDRMEEIGMEVEGAKA